MPLTPTAAVWYTVGSAVACSVRMGALTVTGDVFS